MKILLAILVIGFITCIYSCLKIGSDADDKMGYK